MAAELLPETRRARSVVAERIDIVVMILAVETIIIDVRRVGQRRVDS